MVSYPATVSVVAEKGYFTFKNYTMKRRLLFRVLFSVILGIVTMILFSNYGNKAVHPDLNAMMLGAFLKQQSDPARLDPQFKHYTFLFLKGVTLKGTAVTKDGLFSAGDIAAAGLGYGYSEEGPAEKTVKYWIVDGGYSADVPEVPASLRHFYDPTRPAGERYLTDIANARIMGSLQKYVFSNPHIDGVQWALGERGVHATSIQDHQYTWERGKLWILMALNETKLEKKNEYMASAWRSLGETLHMIADNGCPPHVRNDAHPSPMFNNNNLFGNPDPYEELLDELRTKKPDEFVQLAKGEPDAILKEKFAAMKTAAAIAHEMASYTNANFVTNETISGTDRNGKTIHQITHPETPYNAPLLQDMTYNEEDYTYQTANGVKQCSDLDYFAGVVPHLCKPRVTLDCVKSQARVLIPTIIEAGKNVIKLYIPKLKVEILSAEKNLVKGIIRHTTDEEYTSEIRYNGMVKLLLKDKKYKIKKEIEVLAKNGAFEQAVTNLPEGGITTATIEFGGISIQSPDFKNITEEKASAPSNWVTSKKFQGFWFRIDIMSQISGENRNTFDNTGAKFKYNHIFNYEVNHYNKGYYDPASKGIVFKQNGNILTASWELINNRNSTFKTYVGSATITLESPTTASVLIKEVLYFRAHSEATVDTVRFDCSVKGLPYQRSITGVEQHFTATPFPFMRSLHYSFRGKFSDSVVDKYLNVPGNTNQMIDLVIVEIEE